jgi:hypothetical protein
VHVQVEKIPHTYVLCRYSKEAKSDVNFDRRDRPISGPDGVKLSYRTKVLSLDAQQLVKWGRRSSVAFERATSVMKVLRKQLEEIPADVHGLDADDGVSEHEADVGDGAGPSIHRGGSAGDEISRRPPPKSMTKGRGSDPNETVRLGAPGPKKCTGAAVGVVHALITRRISNV